MTQHRRFIASCATTQLTQNEIKCFKKTKPCGLILFQRNCQNPEQLKQLTKTFRQTVNNSHAPILIDQEGGRVQRMKPPTWNTYPAPGEIGKIYQKNPKVAQKIAYLNARLIAQDLHDIGINVNCIPLLDCPVTGAHDIIGDRAYDHNPHIITKLAHQTIEALYDGGVMPVIKHIPGHGRAQTDSHHTLPIIDESQEILEKTDFSTFKHYAHMPIAMTAHILYQSIDLENPATCSEKIIRKIIRNTIGFKNLLISDDIAMKALSGSPAQKTHAIIQAGCDIVLHCNGNTDELKQIAQYAPELNGESQKRYHNVIHMLRKIQKPKPFNPDNARAYIEHHLPNSNNHHA